MKTSPDRRHQWEVLDCTYISADCFYKAVVAKYPNQSRDKIDPATRTVYFPYHVRIGELVTLNKLT